MSCLLTSTRPVCTFKASLYGRFSGNWILISNVKLQRTCVLCVMTAKRKANINTECETCSSPDIAKLELSLISGHNGWKPMGWERHKFLNPDPLEWVSRLKKAVRHRQKPHSTTWLFPLRHHLWSDFSQAWNYVSCTREQRGEHLVPEQSAGATILTQNISNSGQTLALFLTA